jgi:hypothetical protein
VRAHVGEVHRRLLGHAAHLEAAAQVDDGDVGQRAEQVEGHAGAALPHLGIGAGAHVRVQAADAQAMPPGDRAHLADRLVPDAEARGGPAGIGALGGAGAEAGVHPYRDLAARRDPPELLQLVQRAGVEEDAPLDVLPQGQRGHLRGELDALGREAGPQRPLHLVVAGRVDVQPQVAEEREDAAARVGLHRVAKREAERRREGEGLPRGRLERGAVVDVARRAEAPTHLRRDVGGDAGPSAGRSGVVHPTESTASRLALEVLHAVMLESRSSSTSG